MASSPIAPERPSLALLGSEPLRAALEFIANRTMRAPERAEGDGHPVIIFPGLASDGRAVVPLRDHCRRLGYEAHDWGRGFNTGPSKDVERWLRRLSDEVGETLDAFGQPATLVGWSLGGLYARESAKLLPAGRVRQVITIGTPFNADDDHTNVGWLYRLLNGDGPKIDPRLAARLRKPPAVPTTSLYSRSDGVVAWQTCLHGDAHERVQDIEVHGSHIGMGWNPEVLRIVGDRLRQRPEDWTPYRPPVGRGRFRFAN